MDMADECRIQRFVQNDSVVLLLDLVPKGMSSRKVSHSFLPSPELRGDTLSRRVSLTPEF